MKRKRAKKIKKNSISFIIADKSEYSLPEIDWRKVNSGLIIKRAQSVFYKYLISNRIRNKPLGIILDSKNSGCITFKIPYLLPNEIYIPMETIFNSEKHLINIFFNKSIKKVK